MRYIAIVVMIILVSLLFVSSSEGTQIVDLWPDPYSWDPFVEDANGLIDVYVTLSQAFSSGLIGVKFAAPIPDCLGGVTLISAIPYCSAIGDIESGIEFALGGCYTTNRTLMKLTFWSAGQVDSCCLHDVLPHPAAASGEVEGVDCNSNTVTIYGGRIIWIPVGSPWGYCGRPTIPSNPSPPDGAIEQPLNVTLDWESEATAGTNLGIFYADVYFGESPDPPVVRTLLDPIVPYEVGPLEPNTTYCWKIVSVVSDYGSTDGPVWQFTTLASIPAKKTTWGAIKELFKK